MLEAGRRSPVLRALSEQHPALSEQHPAAQGLPSIHDSRRRVQAAAVTLMAAPYCREQTLTRPTLCLCDAGTNDTAPGRIRRWLAGSAPTAWHAAGRCMVTTATAPHAAGSTVHGRIEQGA